MKEKLKNPFVLAFIFGLVALPALRYFAGLSYHAPPPLMTVEPWALTDDTGATISSESLKGKVWVANFFFSRCPTICVELNQKMKKVTESFVDLKDDVAFVSFSVDPKFDTPAVLAKYREKIRAHDRRWHFATGDKEQVHDVIINRLKFPIEEEPGALMQIAHTAKLALYDQNGDLRALFETDPKSLGALGNAARLLVKKGPNP